MPAQMFPGRGEPPDWNRPDRMQLQQLPPHAYLIQFPDQFACQAAITNNRRYVSPSVILLNGEWDFKLFDSVLQLPENILSYRSGFSKIQVPGAWQTQGFGRIRPAGYVYPYPVCPPRVPDEGPVGVYRRKLQLPLGWSKVRKRLVLQGVRSACHIFVNSKPAGYTQGSGLPAEFDITQLLHDGINELFILVHAWSDGSYLEFNDDFLLQGILRDIYLEAIPTLSILEASHTAHLLDNLADGRWNLTVQTQVLSYRISMDKPTLRVSLWRDEEKIAETECLVHLQGVEKDRFDSPVQSLGKAAVTLVCEGIEPWSAEQPNLYDLFITLLDRSGQEVGCVHQSVGFRTIAWQDGVLRLNGQAIKLIAAQRRDWHARTGPYVPVEALIADIRQMKLNQVNAIRLIGDPPDPIWFELCNIFGLYVIADQPVSLLAVPALVPGRDLEWSFSLHDRVSRLVYRDRSQPCIIAWSLGRHLHNTDRTDPCQDPGRSAGTGLSASPETAPRQGDSPGPAAAASLGDGHLLQPADRDFLLSQIRQLDTTRPIYVEAGFGDLTAMVPDLVDGPVGLSRLAGNGHPVFLSTWQSAVQPGLENWADVVQLIYNTDWLAGASFGEWCDLVLEPDGTASARGPALAADDQRTCGQPPWAAGLVNSERQPNPALQALRQAARPLDLQAVNPLIGLFRVTNRLRFSPVRQMRLLWSLLRDGATCLGSEVDLPAVAPGQTQTLTLTFGQIDLSDGHDYTICLTGLLAEAELWAPANTELFFQEFNLGQRRPLPPQLESALAGQLNPNRGRLRLEQDRHQLVLAGHRFWFVFNQITGTLDSWRAGDRELLAPRQYLEAGYGENTDLANPGSEKIVGPADSPGPRPCIWRVPRPEDAGFERAWRAAGYECLQSQVLSVQSACDGHEAVIEFQSALAAPGKPGVLQAVTRFAINSAGRLNVFLSVAPIRQGLPILPRLGLRFNLKSSYDQISWYGRGPGSSWPGSLPTARTGLYHRQLADMTAPWPANGETGLHADTRWLSLVDQTGFGLLIHGDTPLTASVRDNLLEDLQREPGGREPGGAGKRPSHRPLVEVLLEQDRLPAAAGRPGMPAVMKLSLTLIPISGELGNV